jgi:hypothetical protein
MAAAWRVLSEVGPEGLAVAEVSHYVEGVGWGGGGRHLKSGHGWVGVSEVCACVGGARGCMEGAVRGGARRPRSCSGEPC